MSFWNFIGGMLLFKWLFGKKQNRLDESAILNNSAHSRYSDDDLDARLDGIEDLNDLDDLNDFKDLHDFGDLNGFGLPNERADSDDLFDYDQFDSDPDDFRDPFDDDDL